MIYLMANIAGAPSNAAAPMFAAATMPEWILIGLAVLGVGSTVSLAAFVHNIRNRLPKSLAPEHGAFARTLVKDVKHYADQLGREFATALRVPGIGPESGRSELGAADAVAHVRHLRRLLRGAMSFIRHARTLPLGDWPSHALSHAFAEWAAVVESTDALLDDMFREVTAAVATGRWTELRAQYDREEWFMLRDLNSLPALTKAVEAAAKPFRGKSPRHEESDEAHH